MAKRTPTTVSDLLRVRGRVDLGRIDAAGTPGFRGGKKAGTADVAALGEGLADFQERLYAAGRQGAPQRILLVLQGMDCSGKDGAVRTVVGLLNPQGVRLTAFGKPTDEERRHHFLWRIRRALPGPGYVGVFNRSHYEDVLVVRVHGLVGPEVWRKRYDEINRFEQRLVDEGTTLVKVMLHVSDEEQRQRLLARLEDRTKWWKYNPADVDERSRWLEYRTAMEDALEHCSTDAAPWYLVPADRKWYRDWAVAHLLHEAFERMAPDYPPPDFDVDAEKARVTDAPDPDAATGRPGRGRGKSG